MRWKLGKDSFRHQNELPSLECETSQKNNVFTITQLTPSEIKIRNIDEDEINNTLTTTSSSSYDKLKSKPSENSTKFESYHLQNHNNNGKSALSTITRTTSVKLTQSKQLPPIPPPRSSSPSLLVNNKISNTSHNQNQNQRLRKLSYEEAFKFRDPDDDNKYHHHNGNGNIFVISSNQTDKQNEKSMPWTNDKQNTNYQHHNNNNNNNSTTKLDNNNHNNASSNAIINHHSNNINSNCNGNSLNATTLLTNNTKILENDYSNGTCIIDEGISSSNGTTTNFHHYANSMSTTHPSSNGSLNNTRIGSTTKLLPNSTDDQSSTQIQSKCSYFGGLVLCLCLNITYTNIIRFPRELDNYGTAYLIPYFIILFLVGLPIILLEVSIGQFLGQGAANSWRASPIFKGASVISRFASWLATIWISMQATLAIMYIGMLIFKTVPFTECSSGVKIAAQGGYIENGRSGQECIQTTFLSPIWINAQYFGFLTLGLAILWILMLICTYNGKFFRRTSFFIGTIGFILLVSLSGWEVYKSLGIQYFPELWIFDETLLIDSTIWFNALVQVIYSTNIGFGIIPVVTGKFLHKGDAIRTTVLYFCFNLLINVISVILFMVQFDNIITRDSDSPLNELKPLTAVYDNVINENDWIITRLVPGIIYALFIISAMMSISIAIYTSSRLVPKHPSYVLNLLGLIIAVMALFGPKFIIARVLDSRIVGTLVISALVFDLIATTWIYGVKNIRTDLEFSIGRTIYVIWLILWCISPIILSGILVWWCTGDNQFDLLNTILPRWVPIVFVIAIILVIACIEIFKQVDYNFFGMICEAAKPAKEWGPADPLARHAWKQWRSVCQDTGRKDFTLRRRGTRDYTHSIKRGQYSTAASTKYGTQNWKSSTPGNSSPNYSGSVFGDSAIEEDMSVDKYSTGIESAGQFTAFSSDNNVIKPMRYSNRSRRISHDHPRLQSRHNSTATNPDRHREVVYIRRLSNERNNSTKIEITPANENIVYSSSSTATRINPLASSTSTTASLSRTVIQQQNNRISSSNSFHRHSNHHNNHKHDLPVPALNAAIHSSNSNPNANSNDHICWRKFSVNSEEYSTEL